MKNLSALAGFGLRVRLRLCGHREIDRALSPFHPMGWCAMMRNGAGETRCGFGGQAIDGGPVVTKDTIFRVASISKVVGAAAALQLLRAGKLTLDGDIGEILGFSIKPTITLRQLLTHTASLSDRLAYDRAMDASDPPPLSTLLSQSFLPYAPGTRFRYSNLGAGVVGMLVEKASGMFYDDYVRQAFFLQNGTDASFHPQRIIHKELMANCYRMPKGELAYDAHAISKTPLDDIPNPEKHYFIPAGKLMISAPNLLSLMELFQRECKELFVPQKHEGSLACDSGRGLGVARVGKGIFSRNQAFWGHQGVAYGALSEAWMDLEAETTAVLLTNGICLASFSPLYKAGQSGIAALLDQRATPGVY